MSVPIASVVASEEWLSLTRAAVLLNVSVGTIRKLVAKGELTVRQFPDSHPKVLKRDLDNLTQRYITGPAVAG